VKTRNAVLLLICALALIAGGTLLLRPAVAAAAPPLLADDSQFQQSSDGQLRVITKDGLPEFCPLKHTDVQAEISGFVSRVTVTQEFVNPGAETVEAVYTFPLPHQAAVDDMTMDVGGRKIRGLIKRREEARKIYEEARQAGHTAALLDQERPNIFTQSLTNIGPGMRVLISISYSEVLPYRDGSYSLVFPMVVGPRYIPETTAIGKNGHGVSPDTDRVPDASRITPPIAGVHIGKKGERAGHDISLTVKLDSGVPLNEVSSPTHDVNIDRNGPHTAQITLRDQASIPNNDFILQFNVAGDQIADGVLTHVRPPDPAAKSIAGTDGYFTFILQPPERVSDEDATPRELIFVVDTSGSMEGFPLETAKKLAIRAIRNLRAGDTFNLITFSGDEHMLFGKPVIASSVNIDRAVKFLEGRRSGGGTEMMKAIRAALGEDNCGSDHDCTSPKGDPVRIVCFMTDGYVGNDMEIIGEIQRHTNARVFSFGIGSSVNRFLLEGMARAGRGEAEIVTDERQAEPAADRLYERVHTPVLTDVQVEWNGLPVTEVQPGNIPDLFSAKPVVLSGRYSRPASGSITLRGNRGGKPWSRSIAVNLPASAAGNEALPQT
jgi:Ca-activated chloride channel family protein